MNIIRYITEQQYFSGKAVEIIEEAIKPLLRLMVDPNQVDFDDDLVFCVDALIRKSKGCSLVIQDFYQFLPKIQVKNDSVLANLTDCLNAYIVFGLDFIQNSEENTNILFAMVEKAMLIKAKRVGTEFDF